MFLYSKTFYTAQDAIDFSSVLNTIHDIMCYAVEYTATGDYVVFVYSISPTIH